MGQPLKLNPQQQQQFAQRMNEELDKITMSWDNELREWHPIAIRALDFGNPMAMNIAQYKFIELFNEEKTGLNMNVVMVLNNNLEARSPFEMGYDARGWADVLLLNQKIADRWNVLKIPAEQKVIKEFEIITRGPRIVSMGEA